MATLTLKSIHVTQSSMLACGDIRQQNDDMADVEAVY
jgi:hypothetical protein